MKNYRGDNIRNVAVFGHLACGKTSLTESFLFTTKAIGVKGTVEKKNTTSDFLKEEHDHLSTLSTSLIPVEWLDHKINFIDTPGSEELIGEVNGALRAIDGAILIIDASSGIEVGTERVWRILKEKKIPTIIFVNKMDKENIKFDELIEEIKNGLGKAVTPFTWPIGKDHDFNGFVNVTEMKAKIFEAGVANDSDIPSDLADKTEELNLELQENVAETSEELMEKYFEGEPFTKEEIISGLKSGIVTGELVPLIVGSALKDVGSQTLLEMVIDYFPKATRGRKLEGVNPRNDEAVVRTDAVDEPLSAFCFKTTIDSFIGAINLIKVESGSLKAGNDTYIANTDKKERVSQLFLLRGKNQIPVDELVAGDIGAVAKMPSVFTGCTLSDDKEVIVYPEIDNPSPTIYIAIHPENQKDEDKISGALKKLNAEDITFEIVRNKETSQMLIGGQGITHINLILEKLKNQFGVTVEQSDQKIVYRETIKKTASAQGKYKKQSGGSGQYGDVHIRFEPIKEGFEFAEEVFGGSVPKNYFPAVEKGLIDTLEHGPLAGFPVIGVKATLYDGSYHAVDSSELAFKMAASLSFKNASKEFGPTILEPIMGIEVIVKEDFVGAVMKDLSKRRGRVGAMDPIGEGYTSVKAEVPEAEITKYTIDLKAMTQGGGYFSREFLRYEEVPAQLQPSIIKEYAKKEE